jgi:hypothetical protein
MATPTLTMQTTGIFGFLDTGMASGGSLMLFPNLWHFHRASNHVFSKPQPCPDLTRTLPLGFSPPDSATHTKNPNPALGCAVYGWIDSPCIPFRNPKTVTPYPNPANTPLSTLSLQPCRYYPTPSPPSTPLTPPPPGSPPATWSTPSPPSDPPTSTLSPLCNLPFLFHPTPLTLACYSSPF